MGFKNKNFRAVDNARAEWEAITGFTFGGDTEELANLLTDRRRAEKAGDVQEIERIDDYLQSVRRMSPEEAAGVLGLEAEKEEFAAERKFERKLGQEKQVFDITEERRKATQAETRKGVTTALEGIEGLDATTKALIPLISSGEISGAALNILAAQQGVTFVSGKAGTGENIGESVTIMFDKQGNKVREIVEASKTQIGRSEIITIPGLLPSDPPTFKSATWTEDANGMPRLVISDAITPEELAAESGIVEVAEKAPDTDLISTLQDIGSVGELTPEAFLESLTNREELSDEEIIRDYKKALELQGFTKEKEKVKRKKEAKRLLERLRKPKDIVSPPKKLFFRDRPGVGREEL